MPPVMGSAAFIIAESLQLTYLELLKCAIWPALIYYIAVGVSVHLEAKKNGLRASADVPSIRETLKEGWFLLMPIRVLIFTLCILRQSVYRSAIYAIITSILCSFLHKEKRYRFTPNRLLSLLRESGLSVLTIAAATASAGVVIGCITITGLGVKLAIIITHLAGNSLMVALILVWLVAVLLGVGLPTSAAYITTAALLVSTLNQLGLDKLVAHMFCFYAAIISNLTPPVCIASYTAAGISGGDSWKTALQGFWLGLPGPFLVPFMFAMRPGLLLVSGGADSIVVDLISCLAACLMLSVATRGYLLGKVPAWQRALALAAGVLFITDASMTNLIAIILVAVVITLNTLEAIKHKKQMRPA
jgi:TRAP transporter 4TM/12TM fusion protein